MGILGIRISNPFQRPTPAVTREMTPEQKKAKLDSLLQDAQAIPVDDSTWSERNKRVKILKDSLSLAATEGDYLEIAKAIPVDGWCPQHEIDEKTEALKQAMKLASTRQDYLNIANAVPGNGWTPGEQIELRKDAVKKAMAMEG